MTCNCMDCVCAYCNRRARAATIMNMQSCDAGCPLHNVLADKKNENTLFGGQASNITTFDLTWLC
jgi:hypothetical protein